MKELSNDSIGDACRVLSASLQGAIFVSCHFHEILGASSAVGIICSAPLWNAEFRIVTTATFKAGIPDIRPRCRQISRLPDFAAA
jgi:hypothetical protein